MFESSVAKAAAVAALLCTATAARAADHVILIVDGAYFPLVTHAAPGDRLIFTNTLATEQQVSGINDVWTSGPIAQDGSFAVELDETTPSGFYGIAPDATVYEGSFTFDAAPS